ncbi:O-antigen ligase family protein [Methyloterricola oryzae]|uniref:O-antigen ligase family protein n=1 Tax=Methyloterricola oryzae TaxID=1495050 RepID=UPI0009E65C55|nr:O-antigen ligase family protein [Methyloterricola oryzae]
MLKGDSVVVSRKISSKWVGRLLGLWLCGVFAGMILALIGSVKGDATNVGAVATVGLAVLWPTFYFLFSKEGIIPRNTSNGTLILLTIFFLFGFLSVFFSSLMVISTAYMVLTLLSVLICLKFASVLDAQELGNGLRTYTLCVALLVVAFSIWDYEPGSRLGEGHRVLEPATIGMVSMSAAISAMCFRSLITRFLLISALIYVIYLTGSRASALSVLIGLFVVVYERTRIAAKTSQAIVLLMVIASITLAAINLDYVLDVVEGFLELHDKHRGIDSGGSGRLEVWQETWQLFVENPIFGVGFRAHEARLKLGTSAHNGYLALLAEIGIFGFLSIIILVISGVYKLWRCCRRDPKLSYNYSILIGISVSYLFLAIFERFLINSGNPTSLLFMVAVFLGMSQSKRSSAKVHFHNDSNPAVAKEARGRNSDKDGFLYNSENRYVRRLH